MKITLPPPTLDGPISLEQCLLTRRCHRDFAATPLTLPEISQLAWAAQGITSDMEQRTAPSAGALYPLELLVIAGAVRDLASGVYRYTPRDNGLTLLAPGDARPSLAAAGLGQAAIRQAPASFLFTAVLAITTRKYGSRGVRYVHMEVGHAAQNLCLQATALGLGTVLIGAFDDERLHQVLNLGQDEEPLYLLPVGRL